MGKKKGNKASKDAAPGTPPSNVSALTDDDVANEAAAELTWPWAGQLKNLPQCKAVLRDRYMAECNKALQMKPPLIRGTFVPKAELMVQLLVSLIAKQRTRKTNGDNVMELAAWLRGQRAETAYERMFAQVEVMVGQLDGSPSMVLMAEGLGLLDSQQNFGSKPAAVSTHYTKHQLNMLISTLGWSLGNQAKLKEIADHATSVRVCEEFSNPEAKKHHFLEILQHEKELEILADVEDEKLGHHHHHVLDALKEHSADDQHAQQAQTADIQATKATETAEAHGQWRNDHKIRRGSSKLHSLTKETRAQYAYDEDDSVVVKVAKLMLLQEEFAAIISDPQELANLWHEIDFNDSGDVGYGEWLHFVESKFSIIAHGKPTRLAFVQQDAEDGDMDQVLLKADFRGFLSRLFQYTKLYYCYLYVDTDEDGQVDYDEYVDGGRKLRRVLEVELDDDTPSLTEFNKMKEHSDSEKITWHSLARWYCAALGTGLSDMFVSEDPATAVAEVLDPGLAFDDTALEQLLVLTFYQTRANGKDEE